MIEPIKRTSPTFYGGFGKTLVLFTSVLCAAVFGLPSAACAADDEAAVVSAVETPVSLEDRFDRQFYRALSRLGRGDGQGAFEEFSALRRLALRSGYAELPGYSLQLLTSARSGASDGGAEVGAHTDFMVRRAAELSPHQAEIQLGAANFVGSISVARSLSYLASGLGSVFDESRLVQGLAVNTIYLGLVGLTLALLLAAVVQIASNSDVLLQEVEQRLPFGLSKSWMARGFLAPAALLLLLGLPLVSGLGGALALWGLTLSVLVRGCRWLAAACGAVLVAWTAAGPALHEAAVALRSPVRAAVDRANTEAFVGGDLSLLRSAMQADPEEPVLQFSAAKLTMAVDRAEARRLLRSAERGFKDEPRAEQAARLNLAVLDYLDREYDAARQSLVVLEQEGAVGFELYYNRALSELALTEMEGHRNYYAKALSENAGRLRELEEREREALSPLPVGLPVSVLLGGVGRLREKSGDADDLHGVSGLLPTRQVGEARLAAWGCLGLGLWAAFRRRRPHAWLSERGQRISRLWVLLPGGYYLAGRSPMTGVCLLGFTLAAAMLACGKPVSPVTLFSVPVPLQWVAALAALMLIAATVGLPLFVREKE